MRNYAALGTWWHLRASIIDEYRLLRSGDPSLLNPRLDHPAIATKADAGETTTVFTEVSSIRRVGAKSGLIFTGSHKQPFDLFIPDIDSPAGQEIVMLLETRYISGGEELPRRSYTYVTGELSKFNDKPQMVLHSADQITDLPEPAVVTAGARIKFPSQSKYEIFPVSVKRSGDHGQPIVMRLFSRHLLLKVLYQ